MLYLVDYQIFQDELYLGNYMFDNKNDLQEFLDYFVKEVWSKIKKDEWEICSSYVTVIDQVNDWKPFKMNKDLGKVYTLQEWLDGQEGNLK